MDDYPLLNLFLTMLWFFLFILWIFLLVRVITDVFRSRDLGGWGKAGWTVGLIVFPFLGVLLYLIVRGESMHERDFREAQASEEAFRQYVRSAAAPTASVADELTRLAELRDRGVLTASEFDAEKARLLRGTTNGAAHYATSSTGT